MPVVDRSARDPLRRLQASRRHVLVLLAAALSACGGGGSSGDPPSQPSGQVISSTLFSQATGAPYAIQVWLPASYASGTGLLPVIYATEGDAPYGPGGLSRFDAFKDAMQRRGTQAILVGIGGTQRRNSDFLLPGAASYLQFIATELAPTIERQYRADAKRRALSGLSHGGYFVVAALVLEAPSGRLSFSHYLSTDSSFGTHGNASGYLQFEQSIAGRALPATLFLAGAQNFNGPMVRALYEQMTAEAHPGLTLAHAEYNSTHVGSDLPAFEDALSRYFPAPR